MAEGDKSMYWNQIVSEYLSPIGGIGVLVASIILLVLTYKYLKATKNMAEVMREEFEIKIRPFISAALERLHWSGLDLNFRFLIKNNGFFLVTLLNYEVKCWHEDYKDRKFSVLKKSTNSHIAPNGPIIIAKRISLSCLRDLPLGNQTSHIINLEFKFNFLNARGEEFTVESKLKRTRTIKEDFRTN